MTQKKKVTFNDIAKYTNFSKTTFSRYFNNPDSLTLENQQIISDALQKLDYKENKVARILASGKTEFIGIIVPNLYLRYYSEMLDQILSTYETYGYKFLVFISNGNEENERRYIQELLSYQIEGMIILSHTIPSQELGAVQATSLRARHKCDVLIHVNSPTPKERPAYGRIKGFQDFCEEHHLKHKVSLYQVIPLPTFCLTS